MKKYMIISDTLKQSDVMYRSTIDSLYPFALRVTRTPIRTIELEGVRLHFTDCNTWSAKYRYGNRDMMVVWDNNFGGILYELQNKKMKVVHTGGKR